MDFILAQTDKWAVLKHLKKIKFRNLKQTLINAINKTGTLVSRFKHCAGRFLMTLRRYKGQNKSISM